jgi:D-amino-acid dehydrogenase
MCSSSIAFSHSFFSIGSTSAEKGRVVHVVVIGSGLLGLSTAWFLRRQGAEVTVLERNSGPGAETSFANGGLLTPSMPEPWNSPGIARELLRFSGDRDAAPVLLRWSALPSLLCWGLRFLRNSSRERYESSIRKNVLLARYSLGALAELRREVPFDYHGASPGTMRIFRNEQALSKAAEHARWLGELGIRSQLLNTREALELEPALTGSGARIRGAIYYPSDETGDAHRFCIGLATALTAGGAALRYGTRVVRWRRAGDRVTSVATNNGEVTGDQFVLAAGSESVHLAEKLGLRIPVRPAKGYSVTCRAPRGSPRVPVIDDDMHAAVVPLGENLRIAGTAEFAGFDRRVSPGRIENLLRLLHAVYPQLHADIDRGSIFAWAGLRALSADGVPVLGATPLHNLFVNTGHGPLGWTMAAGSGRVVAERVMGRPSEINLADYSLSRFQESVL